MDLLIGTHNTGKLREYRALLTGAQMQGLPVELLMLDEVGLGGFDVEETAETFEDNAKLKALAYASASSMTALADDTGLEVDALNGRPGVYSARYGGEGLDDIGRCKKLLTELENIPAERRTARFVCVIVVATPAGKIVMARGTCEGKIAQFIGQGTEGFGYDAVFIPEGYEVTLSALPLSEKNRMSHRGQAARNLLPLLRDLA